MKVLESTPVRYDRGLKILTRGRIQNVYQTIADRIASPGAVILDVGCGTGQVALACAARGARVEAIDINAGMLEQAIKKSKTQGFDSQITWHHVGAVQIEDIFQEGQFDGAVGCLSFSEMSVEERDYVLEKIYTRLAPGGQLIIADEVLPDATLGQLAHWLRRLPWVIVTYLLTQTTTRAVPEIDRLIRNQGYSILDIHRPWPGFAILFARRPDGSPL